MDSDCWPLMFQMAGDAFPVDHVNPTKQAVDQNGEVLFTNMKCFCRGACLPIFIASQLVVLCVCVAPRSVTMPSLSLRHVHGTVCLTHYINCHLKSYLLKISLAQDDNSDVKHSWVNSSCLQYCISCLLYFHTRCCCCCWWWWWWWWWVS